MSKEDLLKLPPIECDLKVGDKVIYTNDNGVEFDMIVIGFSEDPYFLARGMFIHLTPDNEHEGAWWFPHKRKELRKKDENSC